MPFKQEPQRFPAAINTLVVGCGGSEIALGGESVMPFYTFDAPIENRPKIGVAITDSGHFKGVPGVDAYYSGAATAVDAARKAAVMPGADFLVIYLEGAHPDNGDMPAGDCAELVREIADAVKVPIAVEGCGHAEKDAKVFQSVSEALQGRNILILSAKDENYKTVAAAAGLAYGQNVGAESAVDVNLAKQLNVLISQMGVRPEKMAVNLGSAAAGYGFEYVASTIERVKGAALAQSDAMLQTPVVTPVFTEAWSVKESIASEDDYPEWGPAEARGVNMEVATAAACLAAGSNAVILMHPDSVRAVSALIDALV